MKKILIAIMCIVLIICYMPIMAFAEGSGTSGGTDIYVSAGGDDGTGGDGTLEKPYASLAKAAEVVNAGAGENFTVHVMSNLKSTKCARFYSKNVTIVGEGTTAPVVSRGDGFATQSDTARSGYNPAMVEVQTSKGPASLTLKNIIFDDDGKHMGTVFAQATSGEGKKDNTVYVQDAIVASNATEDCTVTLGEGAVLRNYGGMSAVRVTDKAQLVMAAGSIIEDTTVIDRTKGKAQGEVGPAGAVWVQGASVEMKTGAEISNVVGRAIYVDGGKAEIGGTISEIKGDADMWQGKHGVAIHLRNSNASATLTPTAVIEKISDGDSAIYVTGEGNKVATEQQSVIKNLKNTTGIYCSYDSEVQLRGDITNLTGSNALSINDGAHAVLEAEGSIHHNACATAVVYLRGNANFTIRGKINDNASSNSKNCATIFIVTNGGSSHATLEAGGEICNNINNGIKYGAAVEVQQGDCSFTMKGGKIIGNKGPLGAIQVHKGSAKFIMNGGEVTDNISTKQDGEAGIYIEDGTPTVELNAGKAQSVTLNRNVSALSAKGNIYISDHFDLVSGYITMLQDTKTVTPADDSLNIKLGNAGADSKTALRTASNGKGWDNPLATFWMQRSEAATLTVGGLNDKISSNLPVYAMALPVGEDGNPEADENVNVKVYASQITDEGIKLTIPEGNTNGYAVALVQPKEKEDFGNVVITTDKSKIDKNNDKTADGNYEIPYTATYNMSENLKSIIDGSIDFIKDENCEFTFTVELDKRLTAKSGAGDYKFTSPIFELKEFTVADDGSTVIVKCKLKADWKEHIEELLETPMVLTGTGVLGAEDFTVGDTINTTGHIEVTISVGNLSSIYVPGNVCQTLMEEEIIPGPGDPQDPGNTDEGAPKTGDATSMELLIGLFMLTVAALAGSIFLRKSSTKK